MSAITTPVSTIALEGAWTIENASELARFLAESPAQLLRCEPPPESAEIDLAGVAEIDGCGCQLLAVFLGHLRRRGISPFPVRVAEEVKEMIILLGFSDLLAASGVAGAAQREAV